VGGQLNSGGVNKTDTAHTAPNDTFKFTPLFGSGEIKLQMTVKAVTPFAGMASFFAWLVGFGVSETGGGGDAV
jgi:hypothetical protein